MKYEAHTEWIRHLIYSSHLECFITCATTSKSSLVIGWMEKHTSTKMLVLRVRLTHLLSFAVVLYHRFFFNCTILFVIRYFFFDNIISIDRYALPTVDRDARKLDKM